MATRRWFLRTSGLTIGALGAAPGWLLRAAEQESARQKILVAIFQRGAADGLNIVVPFFEKRYYQIRPSIKIDPPSKTSVAVPATNPTIENLIAQGAPPQVIDNARVALANAALGNTAIDLDGRFALHPVLQPLKSFWDSGQLAIIHAAGSPDSSRSHFDAQDFMESGMAGIKTEDGWLNRALSMPSTNLSPLRAIASGTQVPRTLRGSRGAVAVDNLANFQVANRDASKILENMYASTSDPGLKAQGTGTFEAVKMIETIRQQPYQPANGAQYPGQFGQRLQQVARLIKANVGVEVAFADLNGWDHHANENGALPNVLREFGAGLAAFARDMGDRMSDIVVVTMSEFGRTAAESGNAGTDHGHGGVMMVLGGPVKGGQIYGKWPGLEPEQLYEGRDLAVTTDFRDVLGELVRDHLGQKPDKVFPGFTVGPRMGLVRTS
jgi:uncharacterized protein (DUF1501 family)